MLLKACRVCSILLHLMSRANASRLPVRNPAGVILTIGDFPLMWITSGLYIVVRRLPLAASDDFCGLPGRASLQSSSCTT